MDNKVAELEQEIERLRDICAAAYQMIGAYVEPTAELTEDDIIKMLDTLSDSAGAMPKYETRWPMAESNKELEIHRLKKKLRQWQKLHDWERMANNYHQNVAAANLGKKPKVPEYE